MLRPAQTGPARKKPVVIVALFAAFGVILFLFANPALMSGGAAQVAEADCPPEKECPAKTCPPQPPVEFTAGAILSEFTEPTCITSAFKINPLTPRMASEVEHAANGECKGLMVKLMGEFKLHRKQWEYCAIMKAFHGIKAPKRALVFAVGTEPLPAYFAAQGISVVATDMPTDGDAGALAAWATTEQHSTSVDGLADERLVDLATLRKKVSFIPVDMNLLPFDELEDASFDFIWSTCAVEHIGSVTLGQAFILNTLRLLRPGGVAIHTVEFSLSSTRDNLHMAYTDVWRRQDVEDLFQAARHMNFEVLDPCYDAGDGELDLRADTAPYSSERHIKLLLDTHVCTSYAMIFRAPKAA